MTGGGGRRIRRTERERLQDRTPPSHTFIALFAGMLMTGGGCYIELDVEKGESGSSIPRPFSTESIWKPK